MLHTHTRTDACTQSSFDTQTLLHREAVTQSNFYTVRLLHRRLDTKKLFYTNAFTHRGLYTQKLVRTEVFTRKLYTEKLLHREASTQSIFLYTEAFTSTETLNTHKAFTHRRIEACSQSLQTEGLTQRGLYTEQLLHTHAFTQRCTEQLLHTDAFTQRSFYTQTLLHIEAFTHRSFYAQKFLHISFTQTSFSREKPLHRASFYTQKHTHTKALHTRLYTQSFYTQTLLRIEACSQSRVYTEQLLHTEAFTQREAFAQSSLYNLIRTETLNTQMPKLLHRHAFTHRGVYTKVLHTDAADASAHRSFWTQMPLHTEAFTERRFDIYTPIHTEAFRHRLFSRESQKLWHRGLFTENLLHTEAFTHTQAFPQKLLHREAFTHRSFYTQTPLHTEACTHGGFYAQKLLHREAFTHRRFPTEKPISQSSFYTHFKKSQFYVCFWRSAIISCERVASGVGKSQFLTLDNHFAWMGCAWPCKIAILHKFYFARNGCAWPFKMDKVAIYTNSWTFASDVKKPQFSHSYCRLTFMPRLHLNFQNHNFAPVFDGCPSFHAKGLRRASPNLHSATCLDVRPARCRQGVARAQKKFTFHHNVWTFETHDLRRRLLRAKKFRISPRRMFAHPTCAISAEGCPRTNKTRISPHVWVPDTPQRVTFRKPPPGCPCRQREIEELEKSDFAGAQIQFDHLKSFVATPV